MNTILYMTGVTQGDALGGIARGVIQPFIDSGLEAIEVNCADPNVFKNVASILEKKEIFFVLSFIGIGRDIVVDDAAGKKGNIWDMMGIPFISAIGDSPAYYFDRHISPGHGFANLYTFREHYDLRKSLPAGKGMNAMSLPFIFDREPIEKIDFAAKEKGKVIFPKNGSSTEQLKALWKKHCRPTICAALMDIADLLEQQMHNPVTDNIDTIVREVLGERGIDIDAMTTLRLFFVAQLDDYLRRAKATMIINALRDFPVEIHGNGWDFIDFSKAKCTYVPGCDYRKTRELIRHSLAVIDMSPNTQNGFHDRILRTYGMHTLCITNKQECMSSVFGEEPGFEYEFTPESLSQRIADVIAKPKHYVEMGREVTRQFDESFPAQSVVSSFVEIADMLRLAMTRSYNPEMQDFFMWPPMMMDRLNPV